MSRKINTGASLAQTAVRRVRKSFNVACSLLSVFTHPFLGSAMRNTSRGCSLVGSWASFRVLLLSNSFLLPNFSRAVWCKSFGRFLLCFISKYSCPIYCCREADASKLFEEVSAIAYSTVVLSWRWWTVSDGLTLGNMSLSYLGSKVTATVRTLDIVWVFCR